MNSHLKNLFQYIQNNTALKNDEKSNLLQSLTDANEALEEEQKIIQAQNRELEIEAALEHLRARTMEMKQSNELPELVNIVWQQLEHLGVKESILNISIIINDTDGLRFDSWYVIRNPVTQQTRAGKLHSERNVTWLAREGYKQGNEKNEDIKIELRNEQLTEWIDKMVSAIDPSFAADIKSTKPERLLFYMLPFSYDENAPDGAIIVSSFIEIPVEFRSVLMRMSKTFAIVYRRYLELQKYEAGAKEAIMQAALDRVRAEIASMRSIKDMDRIIPLIWNEFTVLGIPFIRCGVFIMKDAEALIQTFLSTPNGKAIAAFHIPYSTPGNIKDVLDKWRNHKIYIDHWNENTFNEFANTMIKYGELSSAEAYLKTFPPGGFYLHFIPFIQGMLYVGNTTRLSENDMKTIQSITDAFSTAYARYEDFSKVEDAKQQLQETFNELTSMQAQLVQSEKLASLGELTAGVAHEIQNPLNFINNFSEVNNELIEELKTEMQKAVPERNSEIENNILKDITQNNEKIAFHGKRADDIVKGMLQHSRKNTGQKEPTDINTLADEYIRLSYHGLRAKDKSFNADFKTDFDKSIGKVNIVPQDIARVLLNLFNNAFYAVNEKKKTAGEDYHPMVFISTRHETFSSGADGVEIIIRDNGTGIPQGIIDKIFQPFFTTKPSGKGTGLGLSLSYDIIKAQGGEIKIQSQEGEGSSFIILLPV